MLFAAQEYRRFSHQGFTPRAAGQTGKLLHGGASKRIGSLNELPLFLPKSARAGSALRAFATALSDFGKKWQKSCIDVNFKKQGISVKYQMKMSKFGKIPDQKCRNLEISMLVIGSMFYQRGIHILSESYLS